MTAALPRLVALAPMRHDSERVPGKNYRLFAGKPLYHRIVESLLACGRVDQIVIDTDSPVIMEDAARHFPTVHLVERPARLRKGETPMNDILLHDVDLFPAQFYLQTHSTNPLLRPDTITKAVDCFLERHPERDSLFTVTRLFKRLWSEALTPINHDPAVLLRTQDLPPVYEENSNLFLFTAQSLRHRGNRIGQRPMLFEMDREEAWDIDEEIDFLVAEMLFQKKKDGSCS